MSWAKNVAEQYPKLPPMEDRARWAGRTLEGVLDREVQAEAKRAAAAHREPDKKLPSYAVPLLDSDVARYQQLLFTMRRIYPQGVELLGHLYRHLTDSALKFLQRNPDLSMPQKNALNLIYMHSFVTLRVPQSGMRFYAWGVLESSLPQDVSPKTLKTMLTSIASFAGLMQKPADADLLRFRVRLESSRVMGLSGDDLVQRRASQLASSAGISREQMMDAAAYSTEDSECSVFDPTDDEDGGEL